MPNVIVHNKKFVNSEQIDHFQVVASLPDSDLHVAFGEEDTVDFPRIEWWKNCISFEYQGEEFHISLNELDPFGVDELQDWCIEDFDDAEIDWVRDQIIFTYTTIHPLPKVRVS